MTERDGFIINRIGEEEEVAFIACTKDGSARERTLSGLLRNMGVDFYAVDTRWSDDNDVPS